MEPRPALDPSVVTRAAARARPEQWGLDRAAFEDALGRSLAHAVSAGANVADVGRYVEALHVEDLALATACAAGLERAWDHFVREFRPTLYRAADGIDPTGGARELADALFADLFGLPPAQGTRRSLLEHFHGRSRLATWLRAVLAQRHVDRIRVTRRLAPLPDDDRVPAPDRPVEEAPERARFLALMQVVFTAALAALAPRDRLRLSLYYVRDLTLAQIGRLLQEHEGTVSRHLTRTRRALRTAMERGLGEIHGLDGAAVEACFRSVLEDPGPLDLGRALADVVVPGGRGGKNRPPDRSQ